MQTIIFYLKLSAAGIWIFLVSVVFYLLSFPYYGNRSLSWAYARVLNFGAHLALGIKVHVSGRENMVSGPAVILMNHQSNFDPFLQGPVFPKNAVIIGKKNLLKYPLFGRLFKATNNIVVDRQKKSQGAVVINAAVERLKSDDCYVWIFPEGTRGHGEGLGAFKKGAFAMALGAGVPIIPMVSKPMQDVLDLKNRVAAGGIFEIEILPAIMPGDLPDIDVDGLLQHCEALYRDRLGLN